ncbi:MAG: metallophosphoesterase [Pseudomonadota bacterium]
MTAFRHSRLRLVLLALGWLGLVAACIAALAFQPVHIGRMVMPPEQRIAVLVALALVLHLLTAWTWMALRALLRLVGVKGPRSWIERPAVRATLLGTLLAFAALLGYGRWVEPGWLAVRHVPLGQVGAPGARPLRIAVLSDLHVDGWRAPFIDVSATVRRLEPDVVIFLGDSLGRRDALPLLHRVLQDIEAPLGCYAVRGNWEAWYYNDLPLLQGTHFRWLDDELVTLERAGTRVHLAGLAYTDDEDGARAQRRLAAVSIDDWRVLLFHTPDLVDAVPSADLVLSGHTHGGQVAIPGFGALVTLAKTGKRFERGLVRAGHTWVYTTPGIGVEPAIPLRLGVRPEVTLIELWPK